MRRCIGYNHVDNIDEFDEMKEAGERERERVQLNIKYGFIHLVGGGVYLIVWTRIVIGSDGVGFIDCPGFIR